MVTTGFATGAFWRSFYDVGLFNLLWMWMLALVMVIIWARHTPKLLPEKSFHSANLLFLLSVFIVCFSAGVLRLEGVERQLAAPYLEERVGETVTLEGVVFREPDARSSATHLSVRTEYGNLRVSVDRYQEVRYGDLIEFTGTINKPQSFETDLGRVFNYPGFLNARATPYTVPFARVRVVESGHGQPLIAILLSGKYIFVERIESILPEPQVALAQGLLLGMRQALGEELETAFRKTGIIHIVVLSGFNVMLVVTFVMFVFAYLFSFRLRLVLGILAIAAFAFTVGLSATVARASIMASLILVARMVGKTYAVVRALFVAGTVMLIMNPYLIAFDTGFQLSFLATLGLILIAPRIETWLWWLPSFVGMRGFVTATIATEIFILPVLIYQIGEFSLVSVFVNMLVLPMVPVAMLSTFIAGLLALVSESLALPVAFVAHIALTLIIFIASSFAGMPFASYLVPQLPFFLVPFSYLLVGYLAWRYNWVVDKSSYGDLAERLLKEQLRSDDRKEVNSNFDLRDWTIVEEEVARSSLNQKSLSMSDKNIDKPDSDTPIFFR